MSTEVGTIDLKVRDQVIKVKVWDNGHFSARYGDKPYYGNTLEQVREQLMTVSRQRAARVAVPFTTLAKDSTGLRVRTGVATGIHAGSDNVLVRWDEDSRPLSYRRGGGKATEQISGYRSGGEFLAELTEAEKAEWIALRQAQIDADAAIRNFHQYHALDGGSLREATRKAIEAAAAEIAEAEASDG